jgi:serine/threonine protein phosphatase PrpC
MLVKFAAKAQGISHIEKGIPCQDAAKSCLERNNTIGIACVADGHGGSKYVRSQSGSSFAVTVASKSLLDFHGETAQQKAAFFNKKTDNEEQKKREIIAHLKQLEGNIVYQWRNAVLEDIAKSPLADEEKEICEKNGIDHAESENLIVLYGTTLLAALVSGSLWFVIQIGDGCAIVIDADRSPFVPVKLEDKRLGFGRTTSLCDSEATDNFREDFGFDPIRGLTVATDGVADSFESEKYLQFNKELYEKFNDFPLTAEKALREFLPKLSGRGSGDDVAIAGIFRKEKI